MGRETAVWQKNFITLRERDFPLFLLSERKDNHKMIKLVLRPTFLTNLLLSSIRSSLNLSRFDVISFFSF